MNFEQAVREKAYFLWQAAGCPQGDGAEFWLKAEVLLGGPKEDGYEPIFMHRGPDGPVFMSVAFQKAFDQGCMG
jgi:hypothetical protein